MRNFRIICVKILLPVVFIFIFINQTKGQDGDFFGNFDYSLSSFQVRNMPSYFRNIPAHKADGGRPTGLIIKSQYESMGIFLYHYGAKLYFDKSTLRVGIVFGYSGETEGRNYTNAPGTNERGYGAALTFSGISIQGPLALLCVKPLTPLLFITPKASFEHPINDKHDYPKLAIDVSYQLLTAINGWDRYDNLQCNEFKILAHIIPIGISYRAGLGKPDDPLSFGVGLRCFLNFQTALGKEFDTIIFPVGIFVNYGF
ncbi:MAG: hypothetical protein ACOYL8_01825 [Patescibacteria group bacterium]